MFKIRNTFTMALLLAVGHLLAQQESVTESTNNNGEKPKFELGMQLYGLNARAGDFQSTYHTVWDNQIISGLYFKNYYGKYALRASCEFSKRRIYSGKEASLSPYNFQGQLSSLDVKFGYQRMIGDKKITPYLFIDYEYSYFFAVQAPYYTVMPLSSSFAPYPYYYNKFYTLNGSLFALNPGLGVRWKLSPFVCLNIESAAQLFYFHENTKFYDRNLNSIGINAKPVKISLGVSF